ncbi:hypothetical protein N0V94_004123 [Neodidymelliopsis sp. IMI 364377]|nr:hypothetical protein N0V94_004123 [Neodidymelliopsis sp. IMI 364377]
MSRTPELPANQNNEARNVNKHLRAEVGIYPHWSDADLEDLLTRYQLSEDEIKAEYRERINVFEAWMQNQAKNLAVSLRTMYGEFDGVTEQKILGSAFVWLNEVTLYANFKGYFGGTVKHTPQELLTMRNVVIPGLMWTLKSSQNIATTKNRRVEIPSFQIISVIMTGYRSLLNQETTSGFEVPSEDSSDFWKFLLNVVREQYPVLVSGGTVKQHVVIPETITIDDDASLSSMTSVPDDAFLIDEEEEEYIVAADESHGSQHQRPGETLHASTDGTVTARFRIDLFNGTGFNYVDILPAQRTSVAESGASYILPSPLIHKIPRHTDLLWIQDNSNPNVWRRGHESWERRFLFRSFQVDTDRYYGSNLVGTYKDYINPNDRGWSKRYNRGLDQIMRRHQTGYEKKLIVRWTQYERHALYRSINTWCKTNGVHKFPGNRTDLHKQALKDINLECHSDNNGLLRELESVRTQITNSVNGRIKGSSLMNDLAKRAEQMRKDVYYGKSIHRADVYPDRAIEVPNLAEAQDDDV